MNLQFHTHLQLKSNILECRSILEFVLTVIESACTDIKQINCITIEKFQSEQRRESFVDWQENTEIFI